MRRLELDVDDRLDPWRLGSVDLHHHGDRGRLELEHQQQLGGPAIATAHSACSHADGASRSAERRSAAWLGGGALALLLAPLLTALLCFSTSIAASGSNCPLLQATGVPCPACGATRAFVLFAHGDFGGALSFNWTWLVIWLLLVAALAVGAWRVWQQRPAWPSAARRAGRWLQANPAGVVALPFALLLGPWLVALANLGAIR